MSENMNIPKYREQQLDILRKDPGNSEAIMELMCANVLICEENIKDFCPAYKNAKLCRKSCIICRKC